LGAEVSLAGGDEVTATAPRFFVTLSCEVHRSNAINTAVEEPPSVIVRDFDVHHDGAFGGDAGGKNPWYATDNPEDTELRERFRLFAESGELQDELAAPGCTSARTPECANLIRDNLDARAAWYETNG
jgi:hypothetical protein